MENPVVIVGGGVSGLACALALHRKQIPFLVLEASCRWGGRVGSERVEGFVLDRGFQIYLDSYATGKALLDLDALELKPFQSGALIRADQRFQIFADPSRHPQFLLDTLTGPLPLPDLLRLAKVNRFAQRLNPDAAFETADRSTLEMLKSYKFSEVALKRFWRPFLGGIFLEDALETSARMFWFVFQHFAQGRACLPAAGMQAIPDQMVQQLPAGSLRSGCEVREIQPGEVLLSDGSRIAARAVVNASGPWSPLRPNPQPACGTRCFYFQADTPPWKVPWLVINGEGGMIDTLTFPTLLHPGYAPEGKHLLSVSSLNPAASENGIRRELVRFFGKKAEMWPMLRQFDLPRALPRQSPGHLTQAKRWGKDAQGIYQIGDHLATASIEGALRSGVGVAEEIAAGPLSAC